MLRCGDAPLSSDKIYCTFATQLLVKLWQGLRALQVSITNQNNPSLILLSHYGQFNEIFSFTCIFSHRQLFKKCAVKAKNTKILLQQLHERILPF